MRVILLKDVQEVGEKHQIVDVSNGYARNFLIKKGLARMVSPGDEKLVAKAEEKRKIDAEKELQKIQEQVKEIDGREVEISVKVGEKGQLFEAVTAQKIAEKMKEDGVDISKENIVLKEPIKEIGEFKIKIAFKHNLEAEIKVIIIEE